MTVEWRGVTVMVGESAAALWQDLALEGVVTTVQRSLSQVLQRDFAKV